MGKITESVTNRQYRNALIFQAQRCAVQLDNLEDEKNLAGISRELRLILQALGIDESTDAGDILPKLQDSVNAKLKE